MITKKSQTPIEKLFEGFFTDMGRDDYFTTIFNQKEYDIVEKVDGYDIEMVLPGYKKENIKIEHENDILTISHEVKDESKFHKYVKSFSKAFRLPKSTNTDAIKASMEDGILKVHIPKSEEVKTQSRLIEVQ